MSGAVKNGASAIAAAVDYSPGTRFTAGAVKTAFPRAMPPRAGGAPR